MSHSNATRFLREFYRFYWHARTFGRSVRESLVFARERMRRVATDREVLVRMLWRAGVKYSSSAPRQVEVEADPNMANHVGDAPKNKGYPGFVAIFTFHEDGSLDSVGVWE